MSLSSIHGRTDALVDLLQSSVCLQRVNTPGDLRYQTPADGFEKQMSDRTL